MAFELQAASILTILLVATRLAGMFAVTPVFGFMNLPGQVRVVVVLALSMILAIRGLAQHTSSLASPGSVVLAFAHELLLGSAMGFGIAACFAALSLGGRLLDYQMGFAAALLFDPATKSRAPLFGTILSMLGVVLFLELDGHHAMLRALAWSLRASPPGAAFDLPWADTVVAQYGVLFGYGFLLVAPAVACLMIVDIAVAVSARTMPQVNAYFVALPAKVFTGILVLALSLRVVQPLVSDMFASAWPLNSVPPGSP